MKYYKYLGIANSVGLPVHSWLQGPGRIPEEKGAKKEVLMQFNLHSLRQLFSLFSSWWEYLGAEINVPFVHNY